MMWLCFTAGQRKPLCRVVFDSYPVIVAGWYFFFSSRRRHTRCSRDWSSDVCSSDLAAELDFRLAELGGFRSKNKITKRREFHAAPEAVTADGSNGQALGGGQAAKHGMKRGEHFADTLGGVIGNIGARAKCSNASALKNHRIGFRQRAFERRVKRLHHGDVQNVQRRAVERDPRPAVLDVQPNRFGTGSHA